MLRRTNYGMLVDDLGTSSEDEKALAEVIKIAESVGMEIIENKTAISIKFCLEIMKRLVNSGTDERMHLLNHIENLEERIKQIKQEPCEEAIKNYVWKFAIHCMELGYGVDILKQYTASEAMAKLEKFKKLEQIAPCGDAISRQWIKTAIHNFYDGLMHTPTEEDIQAYLSAAPSVQPKVVPIAEIRFDDDKLHEIVDEAIKNIEITPRWIPVSERLPRSHGVYQVIKNIEITPRWIPVSERLPRSHGVYQVTIQCEEGRYTSACYFDGSNTWHNDNRINHGRPYVTDKVIAWQEEPEPYKAESEGRHD